MLHTRSVVSFPIIAPIPFKLRQGDPDGSVFPLAPSIPSVKAPCQSTRKLVTVCADILATPQNRGTRKTESVPPGG
ncbi:hypothetical protein HBI49_077890 [Parastagonospora nodorum]|nr:hypothetical protein HBH51_092020 [Parastagonospora nodorum]KAH5370473.1 hypothetical protein HBI49_077890 [Parastagonospora nodorum]KAH5541154.1 hypothetical protein HBI27_091450 [Parastagonospora nodorum]